MAINYDLYSPEKLEQMKKLKNQTQGQGDVDPNLVDMAMAEQSIISGQPAVGSDDPNYPLENQAVVEMDENTADKFLTLSPDEQAKNYDALPPMIKNVVDERRATDSAIAAKTPGNIPYSEGLMPQGTTLPGNVPYREGMTPQTTIAFKPTETPAERATASTSSPQLGSTPPRNPASAMSQGEQGITDYYKALNEEQKIKDAGNLQKENMYKEQVRRNAEIDQESIDKLAVEQKAYDDLSAKYMNSSINQNRIFENQSTNQRVMTGIGLFLGALSNAFTGQKDVSKNPAVMAIDKAIENDIKSQEVNMAKMKEGLNIKNNRLSQLTAFFKDKKMALREEYALHSMGIAAAIENQLGKSETLKNDAMAKQMVAKYRDTALSLRNQNKLIMSQIAENEAKAAKERFAATQVSLTPGQKAVDEKYAEYYNNFSGSGAAIAKTTIDQLKGWRDTLLEESKSVFEAGGGRVASMLPDAARTRQSLLIRDQIPAKANLVLKELFGGQLSNDERVSESKTYYSDNQDSKTNAQILTDKIQQLENKYNAEMAKAKYYEQNKSLRGFETQVPKNMKKGL